MKYFTIFVLCTIALCEAEDFSCQLFNERTKLFEYYCKDGKVSESCVKNRFLVESSKVTQLKIRGCNEESVSYAVEACEYVNVLDISNSGYDSLDSFDLKHSRLKVFNASFNELTNLQPHFFARVPELIEVDLSHNKFGALRSFTGVDNIKRIDLSHNNIDSIADDAFNNFIHLEFVDLSNNKINLFKANVYSNVRDLQTLHLENNPIDTFNCENLLKMKTISVYTSWNAIEFFNTECEAAKLYTVLDSEREGFFPASNGMYEIHCHEQSFERIISFTAGHNQIDNIVELIQCFGSSLVGLYLDGNIVSRFDDQFTFERFTNLKELSLRDTELIEFDFALLKKQDQLRTLDVSNNTLRRVTNIWLSETLENLIEFSAAQNRFENVTEIFQHLTSAIKTLDLSSNFVGKLTATDFGRFVGLEVLNLSNTTLSLSDFSPFEPLENLEMLDISYNDLSKTNFSTLSLRYSPDNSTHRATTTTTDRHEYLRALNLSHTNLPIADFKPFERLRSLENLDVSHNQLGSMNFTRLSVKILDLSGNFLGGVNANTFERLRNLVGLKLSNTSLSISDSNPFEPLKRLAVLDVSNNNLEKVDFKILSPTMNKLFGFEAINCHLKNVSAVIQHLGSTLMKIDLSENFIGHLNIDKFKTLYSLHLSRANITTFNFNTLNTWHLRSLKLSYNQLREIDFQSDSFADNSISELNLEGNELVEIRNLSRHRFKWLRSLAISKNRLSCECLTQLIREWNGKFVGDPWDQKHDEDCHFIFRNTNITQTTPNP